MGKDVRSALASKVVLLDKMKKVSAFAKVVLSGALQSACLVKVGDALPNAELPDAAGKIQSLKSLYGERLTVVFCWTVGLRGFGADGAADRTLDRVSKLLA